jgi:hypothetical protein
VPCHPPDAEPQILPATCPFAQLDGKAKTAAAACDAIIATRRKQLDECQAELVRQVAFARDAIKKFEDAHPVSKLSVKETELRSSPADNFKLWQQARPRPPPPLAVHRPASFFLCSHDPPTRCSHHATAVFSPRQVEVKDSGDVEANELMGPLIKQGLAKPKDPKVKLPDKEKNFKDKMAWTRDQVPAHRRPPPTPTPTRVLHALALTRALPPSPSPAPRRPHPRRCTCFGASRRR